MILKGWDGINFEILMNPKQMKALHDATMLLKSEDLEAISKEFNKKGFKLTPVDIHALITEFQITTREVSNQIHHGSVCPHEAEPSDSDETPEAASVKKEFVN